jgi:hypothetical protein
LTCPGTIVPNPDLESEYSIILKYAKRFHKSVEISYYTLLKDALGAARDFTSTVRYGDVSR